MNWMLIVSGFLAAFCTVGHFIMGGPRFLRPMLDADFDAVPKKVMHAVFHYISVDFILSTLVLLAAGFGLIRGYDLVPAVFVVTLHFLLYTVVQLIIAFGSGIQKAPFKMFQWILFLLTGAFGLIGVL